MRAMAQRLAGRLIEATRLSESAYVDLLPRRSGPGTAVEANSLGLIWLARGRVRTALRLCRESAALLRDGDGVGMLAFALAGVVQAASQAAEVDAANAALAEMERTPLGHKGFSVDLELARVWSAAAKASSRGRRRTRARRPRSHWPRPGRLRGPRAARAVPVGRPDRRRGRARPARRQVDGPFASTAAAYAAALVARDAAALLVVAERFAAADAMLVAAEAADAASAAHRDSGRRPARAPRPRAPPSSWRLRRRAPAHDARRAGCGRPHTARARDRAARRRRVEQPPDRRPARDLRAYGRQPPPERVPQARRQAPPGPVARPQRNARVARRLLVELVLVALARPGL